MIMVTIMIITIIINLADHMNIILLGVAVSILPVLVLFCVVWIIVGCAWLYMDKTTKMVRYR